MLQPLARAARCLAFILVLPVGACTVGDAGGDPVEGDNGDDQDVADWMTRHPVGSNFPVIAEHGMAATLHPIATQVALDIMKEGGNAVDAVIAANAATAVVLPTSNGLGGDLFAFVWIAEEQELYGLNSSGRSPMGLTLGELREALGDEDAIPLEGPLAALTVPGAVAGWFELHERFGSLPMARILEPAIRLAREGAPGWGWSRRPNLAEQPGFAETFLPGGEGPEPGEIFRNPDIGQTLEMIAQGGRAAFYEGEIARTVDAFCERVGCFLREEDFAAHESTWVDPLGADFRGYTVWQLPPNTQGLTVIQMLKLLEPFDLEEMGPYSPDFIHHLIEAKKIAFEDRARYFADPERADVPIQELISDDYIDRRRRLLDPAQAATEFPPEDPRTQISETTYMAMGDPDGNMVSLIQSNYAGFGSGLVPDGLGFGLQNRGALFALEEGHPNVYEPGKRPFHTIIPGFVTKDGEPYYAFGATGGDMQPQAQVNIFLNHILFGMNIQEAADAPRFRHYGSTEPTGGSAMADGGCIVMEAGYPPTLEQALVARGHRLCEDETYVGGGYAGVLWDIEHGVYWGGKDSRRYGLAAGW